MSNEDTAPARLSEAVGWATAMFERVSGGGSVLEQLAALRPADLQRFPVEAVLAAAQAWAAAAESARRARAMSAPLLRDGVVSPARSGELADLVAGGLPFNRKERFFTGTVLPMIVVSDDFAHLGRLFALCGLEDLPCYRDGVDRVQFYTEYGFAESLFGLGEARFEDAPKGRDTPDVVIYCDEPYPRLLAIEAKMYHRPTRGEMVKQLAAQRELVAYLAGELGVTNDHWSHVALLPVGLDFDGETLGTPVVTWEELLAEFEDVAPPHWSAVLRMALNRYPELVGKSLAFGTNAQVRMTGTEIVEQFTAGTLEHDWVGRRGGSTGALLADDVTTGKWKTFSYECSSEGPANPNWMPAARFVERVVGDG